MSATSLISSLECPSCHANQIVESDKQLSCISCKQNFTSIGEIIPLYADQKLSRIQWQSKFAIFKTQIESRNEKAFASARSTEISDATKQRLTLYSQFLKDHLQELTQIISDWGASGTESANLSQLFSQRVPSSQHILSYYLNIFRDWAWDGEDNQLYADMVAAQWADNLSPLVVVLGSGPGRLAFDLAEKVKIDELALFDINPIQLKISAMMAGGNSATLTELNEFPAHIDKLAKKWALKPPQKKLKAKVSHFWADAIHLPLKKNSEVTLLTPWFIDIIPEDFAVFARRLNTRLNKGQCWINFGPLGFGNPEKARTYTAEEIKVILQESGFELESWDERDLPYLNSPLSSQKRRETVFAWRARKTKVAKEPPRFNYYPTWMTNLNEPIPTHAEFQSLALKSQFEAQIFSSVDGKLSLNQFAQLLAKHSNMNQPAAEELLLTFFSHWYETQMK